MPRSDFDAKMADVLGVYREVENIKTAAAEGGSFNWLSCRFAGKCLPAIDFAHDDISRCQQRPKQHRGRVGGWQHGLGFDASFDLKTAVARLTY